MKLFPDGDKVLAVLSRYTELLAMDKKEGYEPGDIFAFIVPFLLLHNIQDDQIADLSYRATLTDGASNLISQLEYNGWKIFCLTAAYEPYALHTTQKLGIYAHRVACTPLPLSEIYRMMEKDEIEIISQTEKDILDSSLDANTALIKQKLDSFYARLAQTGLADILSQVKPVGGRRKLEALKKLAEKYDQPLSSWVMVGDTQEDYQCIQTVEEAKGLAIAFNAEGSILSHSTLSTASTNIGDLMDVLQSWQKGGRSLVERLVREKERIGGRGDRGYFHWLSGRTDFAQVSDVHRRLRLLVKENASKPV